VGGHILSVQTPGITTGSAVALRAPDTVMALSRMGAFHQTRLSFMRVLLRNLKRQRWTFDRPLWSIDADGVGYATYRAIGPERTYTLVVFAHDLPDEKRSDRVIADAWDSTFTLFDGEPDENDIRRLRDNVPFQEAGRLTEQELTLSRANKSVRLFNYTVDRLASGKQPEAERIEEVGYLMRTTAVYGAAKFGAADRQLWKDRKEFGGSFQPELLTVWLIRSFTLDLVEHLASRRSPATSVNLEPALRRRFGVGNSTGLGMAPFLVNHPALIHSWIHARETALSRVRSVDQTSQPVLEQLRKLIARALLNGVNWKTSHSEQARKVDEFVRDLEKLQHFANQLSPHQERPWDHLFQWCTQHLENEALEQLVSLLIELYPELVDDLAAGMQVEESEHFRIDGRMSLPKLRQLIETRYKWALDTDFSDPASVARVWYTSIEKLEPRLAERHEPAELPGNDHDDSQPSSWEPYEQALAPGRDVSQLYHQLANDIESENVASFLLTYPEHRHSVRRVQLVDKFPYAEIHGNTIASDMKPVDLLRCKLSFFGATRFDPRSDRWVRITMFKGAPFPSELSDFDPDDLAYPPLTDDNPSLCLADKTQQ